jgi:hypothetical protein
MPEIQMPKLSDTMTGALSSREKRRATRFQPASAQEIETDKATMEWNHEDGTITGFMSKKAAR